MAEIKAAPADQMQVVETPEGTALCLPDGTVHCWLDVGVPDDERDDFDDEVCDTCGDTGPWVDSATGMCEMCMSFYSDEDDLDDIY